MHLIHNNKRRGEFNPLVATRGAQAAMMTLPKGGASDEVPSNEHPKCEQWLFVISGTGEAIVGKSSRSLRRRKLSEGSLLVIERRELHQIRNTGAEPLRTINVYVPPAYEEDAKPRLAAGG